METDFPPVTPPSFPASPPETNTLATTSLILSLAGLPLLCAASILTFCGCFSGLLALGAVTAGFIARQQIKSTGEQGDDMALTGMIIGGIQVLIVTGAVLFWLVLMAVSLIGAAFSS